MLRKKNLKLLEKIKFLRENEPVYIGKHDDSIDLYLAYWLNSYPRKHELKILFIRQSEGVYLFGSLRTVMRMDA